MSFTTVYLGRFFFLSYLYVITILLRRYTLFCSTIPDVCIAWELFTLNMLCSLWCQCIWRNMIMIWKLGFVLFLNYEYCFSKVLAAAYYVWLNMCWFPLAISGGYPYIREVRSSAAFHVSGEKEKKVIINKPNAFSHLSLIILRRKSLIVYHCMF